MKKEAEKTTNCEPIGFSNELKIARYRRDLQTYSKLINDCVLVFQRTELIDTLTDDLCAQLVCQDITPFKNSIIRAFEDEAQKHNALVTRKEYKDRAGKILAEVNKIFEMFMQSVQMAKLQGGLRLDTHERIAYIQVRMIDGKAVAVFDDAKIVNDNSHQYTSKNERAFIERTKRLHADMLAYQQECKRMGGTGIADSMYSIIAVDEYGIVDKIEWSNLQYLNF